MATVGQQLTSPEAGWRRYDDTDPFIRYVGNWGKWVNPTPYNGSVNVSTNNTNYAFFKFKGTKLRIISDSYIEKAQQIRVTIDDSIVQYFSERSSGLPMRLSYEILGLPDEIHTVHIQATDIGVDGADNWNIDAIDIDSTGYLIHPNLVNSLDDMQVGDVIACGYTAKSGSLGTFFNLGDDSNSLIPAASSASPNGKFYFVFVGYDHLSRMKLVADRNIQHTLSWDRLNESGLVGGEKEVEFINMQDHVPVHTSSISSKGEAISSSSYSTFYAWRAFDGNKTSDNRWLALNNANGVEWVGYRFNSATPVNTVEITSADVSDRRYDPNNFCIEGSYDGVVWEVLKSFSGISWTQAETKQFNLDKTYTMRYYRIRWTSLTDVIDGYRYYSIQEIKFIHKEIDKKFNMRLLSGGVSGTDKDNEWDKIIVEYNLDGKITAGDNSVWNWSGVGSWTSTTPTAGNTSRVIRGNSEVGARTDNQVTSASSANIGFRPVVLVPPFYLTVISSSDIIIDTDVTITGFISYIRNTRVRYRYSVLGSSYPWTPFENINNFTIVIPYNTLNYGDNIINVEVESEEGYRSSALLKVNKKLTILLRPDKIYYDGVDLEWTKIDESILDDVRLEKLNPYNIDPMTIFLLKVSGGTYKDVVGNTRIAADYGGVTVSSGSPINEYSLYFNGTHTSSVSGKLRFDPINANFGLGDFTIEFWLKWESRTWNIPNVLVVNTVGNILTVGEVGYGNGDRVRYNHPPVNIISNTSVTDGQWHHCAICRKDGIFYMFIDGILDTVDNANTSVSINYSGNYIFFGGELGTTNYFKGWMDEFTFVKGKALYTENFIPKGLSKYVSVKGLNKYRETELNSEYPYEMSITGIKNNNIIARSNHVSVIRPPEPHLRYVWNGEEYELKVVEGLAFQSAGGGEYYTLPHGIKVKPLNVGNIVGGKSSNIFAFEISNTFDNEDYDVELKVSRNGVLAEDKGDFALLYDAVTEKYRTEVYFSLDGVSFTTAYPLTTHLAAGESKTVFMRIKPSTLTNGPEIIQVHLTGRRA